MSTWAFAIPFVMCVVSIVGGIALHFYAEWSGKREEEREARFYASHQTEWTDELARRRQMRERAEARMGPRQRRILIEDAERYTNRGTVDDVAEQLEAEGYTRIGKYEWQRNQGTAV